MTYFYAQPKTIGAWYDKLLDVQAEELGRDREDLTFLETLTEDTKLVAVNNPAPVRGYATLTAIDNQLFIIAHVLKNQPVDVYRALVSQIVTQYRLLHPDYEIVLDTTYTTDRVREGLLEGAKQYGIQIQELTKHAVEPSEVSETKEETFTCDHCDRNFTTKRGLTMHSKMHEE